MITDCLMILCACGFLACAILDLHADRKRQLAELDDFLSRYEKPASTEAPQGTI